VDRSSVRSARPDPRTCSHRALPICTWRYGRRLAEGTAGVAARTRIRVNFGTMEEIRLHYISRGKIIPIIPTDLHILFPGKTISTISGRSWLIRADSSRQGVSECAGMVIGPPIAASRALELVLADHGMCRRRPEPGPAHSGQLNRRLVPRERRAQALMSLGKSGLLQGPFILAWSGVATGGEDRRQGRAILQLHGLACRARWRNSEWTQRI
jgi:hypothetical protein